MEEILKKDIFNNKDLCKLSPDYTPSEVLLRMEMRKNMVKDTHNHGILRTYNWQRKIIRKPKPLHPAYTMNKEIVNLKNSFHNNNIKNQVLLKHGIHSLKIKSLTNLKDNFLIDLDDGLDFFLSKSPKLSDDLVVCNDGEFKLNNKPKQSRATKDVSKLRKGKKENTCIENAEKTCDKEEDYDMKVECRYTEDFSDNVSDKIIEDKNIEIDINDTGIDCTHYIRNAEEEQHEKKTYNAHKDDLQTLLIMMALTSKPDETNDMASPQLCNDITHEVFDNTASIAVHEQTEDISNILNVTPLRIQISSKELRILTKYVMKWKDYVNRKKEFIYQQRQAALNSFLDKLSKKKLNTEQSSESVQKAKLLARDYATYQHRYKMQKHIIALQKAKLEEQSRMIEELKYNRIVEASKQSVDDMREEIRKTYYEIDKQLKPKIKCLVNELKIQEIEEPALVLHCLKVPQFLKRMEKRAREREEKHAMIRERRRQMEEERVRLKQQAELAKAEMDKEEKMRRIAELREKRKKDRIEAIRKKQHVEKLRALIVMADLHYERYLMNKYGIRPLKKLVAIKRDNVEKAKAHYIFQLKKNIFYHLMWYTEDMIFERNYKAEDFHRKKILKKAFEGWKQVQQQYIVKKQVADDYYDLYVVQLVFRHFRRGIDIIKRENELKFQKAVKYHNGHLMFKIFTCWRTLPALNALKREQEARKARWREKVLLVVPDYTPPDD